MSHEDKHVALKRSTKRFVMGDIDRKEFQFNVPLSDDELVTLLENNAYVSIACFSMPEEAFKNGFELENKEKIKFTIKKDDPANGHKIGEVIELDPDEYLEKIKFAAKFLRGVMFARLHGESIAVFFNEDPDLDKASEDGTYTDFKIYHRLAHNNGWRVKEVDGPGNPTVYNIKIINTRDPIGVTAFKKRDFTVNAKRVVIFPNPMKGQVWGGTPTSRLMAHQGQLIALIQKWMGKHALDIASPFWLASNISNIDHANELIEEIKKFPLLALLIDGEMQIEAMMLQPKGFAKDFQIMLDVLKDYISAALRVSRQTIDGAPEGTLSSAEFNTIMSMGTIQGIQTHWKPILEETLQMLGFKDPNITWNKPMELKQLGEDSKPGDDNDPGSRASQQTQKQINKGKKTL